MSTSKPIVSPPRDSALVLDFDDNRLLSALFGERDSHLAYLEKRLGIHTALRGNRLVVSGAPDACRKAEHILRALYDRVRDGRDVGAYDVDDILRMMAEGESNDSYSSSMCHNDKTSAPQEIVGRESADLKIITRRRHIQPRSAVQGCYVGALRGHDLVFALGPAGCGKTYLAVAHGAALLGEGRVDRIILSRPAVEAGERLGFLPGDMREKVDPYLRPLYDALHDVLPSSHVSRSLAAGDIEVAPLAFMRGRTLSNAFIILDEAQNCTAAQIKMFLTRLGEGSSMVVTGDPSQIDLPGGARSGLEETAGILKDVEGISVVRFSYQDVVRNALVSRIVSAYESHDRVR
ncbi:MAG: PhoH family protein [Parvularculales bacterium]